MDLAITLALGLLGGMLYTWFIQRDERTYLRDELKAAHAQIAHAVIHESAEIPARTEEIEPMKPLSSRLAEVVTDWEDPESRAIEEGKIRNLLGQGWGEEAILRQYRANP